MINTLTTITTTPTTTTPSAFRERFGAGPAPTGGIGCADGAVGPSTYGDTSGAGAHARLCAGGGGVDGCCGACCA